MANSGQRNRRPAWEDRFERPRDADLLGPLAPTLRTSFAFAREQIVERFGALETLVWMGVPWRWCYRFDPAGSAQRPLAYLVPDPVRPLLALPLAAAHVAERDPATLTRRQQDAIACGTRVGEVLWLNWEVTSRAAVEEAFALIPSDVSALPARARVRATTRAGVGAAGRSGR